MFYFITTLILLIKFGIFSVDGLTIDWDKTKLAGCLVLRSTKQRSRVEEVLLHAGGFMITPWAYSAPVIVIGFGQKSKAFFWHEVGHLPDIRALIKTAKFSTRLSAAVFHNVWNPLALPAWLLKVNEYLVKVFKPKTPAGAAGQVNGAQLILDAGFEIRADQFSASKVGASVLHGEIYGLFSLMLGCPANQVLETLKPHAENPAVASTIERLQALDALAAAEK